MKYSVNNRNYEREIKIQKYRFEAEFQITKTNLSVRHFRLDL